MYYSECKMFNWYIVVGLVALMCGAVFAEPLDNAMIVNYDFNTSSINGSSLSDLSGAPYIDASMNGVSSYKGQSLTFDGTDDYVSFGAMNLNSTNVTISAWVYRDGDQWWDGIVFCRAANTVAGLSFGGSNELRYTWNSDSATYSWNSNLTVPDKQWSHVVLVVEPDKATIYLNGIASVHSHSHAIEQFDGVTLIGKQNGYCFKGKIDEVAVWNRALALGEVQAVYSDGLLRNAYLHYTLDNVDVNGSSIRDISSEPFHDGSVNGPSVNWYTNHINQSMLFDGSDDYISVPAMNLNTNSYTVSAWLYRDGDQYWDGIVSCGENNTRAAFQFGSANELRYVWNNDPATYNWNSGLVVPNQQWSHVVLVVEPDKATIYLNGVSAVNNVSHSVEEFDASSYIGRKYSNYFDGFIDDVFIWNRAVSSEAVDLIYKRGVLINRTFHFTLDECDIYNSEITDISESPFYDGLIEGNAVSIDGQIGEALEFDGTEDYIVIPAMDLNTNKITISAWIKRDGNQSWDGIVFSRGGNTVAGLMFGSSNELRYNWNNNSAAYSWNSGLVVPDGQWCHVALVVEPTQAAIYLNGTSAINSISHSIEEFDGKTYIGFQNGNYFKGLIDDVAMWDSALNSQMINYIYAQGQKELSFYSSTEDAVRDEVDVEIEPGLISYDVDPLFFGANFSYSVEKDYDMLDGLIENYLDQMPCRIMRYPGGGEAENYLWDVNLLYDNTRWPYVEGSARIDIDEFMALCQSVSAEPMITVNTRIASLESLQTAIDLATDWVEYCNITNNYNVKYWEIGNEPYYHARITAEEYANIFVSLSTAMKAVDPSIKCLAVGEWDIYHKGKKEQIPSYLWPNAYALEDRIDRGDMDAKDELEDLMTLPGVAWWPEVLDEINSLNPSAIDMVAVHWYFTPVTDLDNMTDDMEALRTLCQTEIPNKSLPITITEWNIGHWVSSVGQQRAVYFGEAVGRLLNAGVEITNVWPLRCGGLHSNKNLLDYYDKTPTANFDIFSLFARLSGEQILGSKTVYPSSNSPVYHFSTISDKSTGTPGVFLINSSDKAVLVDVKVPDFEGSSITIDHLRPRREYSATDHNILQKQHKPVYGDTVSVKMPAYSAQHLAFESAQTQWTTLTWNGFVNGWGYYTDGGADCYRSTGVDSSDGDDCCIVIQDNSGTASSFYHTNGIDVSSNDYTQIRVEFWFKGISMENGENFFVQYFDGSSWNNVGDYVKGTHFENNQWYHRIVYINESDYNFPTNMKIRFLCDASADDDDVYIDDIKVLAGK